MTIRDWLSIAFYALVFGVSSLVVLGLASEAGAAWWERRTRPTEPTDRHADTSGGKFAHERKTYDAVIRLSDRRRP